jgi:uncharacterized OsmC-like protein
MQPVGVETTSGGTMGTKRESLVRQRQSPLRERYRSVPGDAWISDGALTVNGCGGDPFHGVVVPANGADAPLCFGIHRAIGGFHDYPNPGDLLSAALAACFDSTLRMLAEHLGISLASLDVKVDAECDVRGCLMVDPSVPVGFQQMTCRVRVEPDGDVDDKKLRTLVAAAENCCVVMQTLRNGVAVEARIEAATAESACAAVASQP